MAKDPKYIIAVDDYEKRIMVKGLFEWRNMLLEKNEPIDDINDIIVKIIDAPYKKHGRLISEAR